MKRNSQTTPPTIETVETLRQQLDSIARSLAVESEHERAEHAAAAERCLLYTSPSPRDRTRSRMPSSA